MLTGFENIRQDWAESVERAGGDAQRALRTEAEIEQAMATAEAPKPAARRCGSGRHPDQGFGAPGVAVALDLSRVGASDAPAILGLDPYRTVHDVYARIVYGISSYEPEWLSEAAQWGVDVEPITARRWALSLGLDAGLLIKPPSRTPAARPWQRYSCDFVSPGRLLECKTISERRYHSDEWGSPGAGVVPLRIVAQVHVQLEAMRSEPEWWRDELGVDPAAISTIDIAACVGGNRLHVDRVPYDPELGAWIREEIERFWWDHVTQRKLPPPNQSEACMRSLQRIYPRALESVREATQEEADLLERLRVERCRLEEIKSSRQALENKLATAIGAARGVRGPNGAELLWLERAGSTQWKKVAEEIAADCNLTKHALEACAKRHRGDPTRYLRANFGGENE